jgi:hypothetical protein
MANKDNLLKLVAQKLGPDQLKQMVDQAVQALGQDPDVTPEVITQMIMNTKTRLKSRRLYELI